MSGAAAVEAMLSAESRNVLIIPEGKRNADIYKMIDKKLEIDAGTTAKVASEKAGELGLPDWAKGHPDVKDPLEGFPTRRTIRPRRAASPRTSSRRWWPGRTASTRSTTWRPRPPP